MTALVDRCPRCRCANCGGLLEVHTDLSCGCEECTPSPASEFSCRLTGFTPPMRIGFIAEQLGPLLSSHLNEAAARRCLAVAHAAHHALHDYDHPEDAPDA